jgi:hypothetical protein
MDLRTITGKLFQTISAPVIVFCGIALRCWVCESERMNRTFEACRSECGKRVHAAEQEGALCGQTPGSRGSFFQVDATITCLACLKAITEATKPAEDAGCLNEVQQALIRIQASTRSAKVYAKSSKALAWLKTADSLSRKARATLVWAEAQPAVNSIESLK